MALQSLANWKGPRIGLKVGNMVPVYEVYSFICFLFDPDYVATSAGQLALLLGVIGRSLAIGTV